MLVSLPSQRSTLFKFKHHRFLLFLSPFSTSSPNLLPLIPTARILQQAHARLILHGHAHNSTISRHLVARYAELGRVDLSLAVLSSARHVSPALHASLLRNFSLHGCSEETLIRVYSLMLHETQFLDESVYPFVFRACPNLRVGQQVHTHVAKLGFESSTLVGNALIETYLKNGALCFAQRVFDEMPEKNSSSRNMMISWVCECGNPIEGFRLFERMILEGFALDSDTVVNLLRACVLLNSLEAGKLVHKLVIAYDLFDELSVSTALLTMYCKLGRLETARILFDKIGNKDTAVWNIMISGYSRNGYPEHALELLIQLGRLGMGTDLFTALGSLVSITELKSLSHGKQMHGHVIRNEIGNQVSVYNAMIDMYSTCGCIDSARNIFDSLVNKTTVSYSSMIKGYVNNDLFSDALLLFNEMRMDQVKPDSITLISILPACVSLSLLNQVNNIHGHSIKLGLVSEASVGTALLVSYAKCGCIELAQKIFNQENIIHWDLVSWNSVIGAYSNHGDWYRCFEMYEIMKGSNVYPDRVTFLELLKACVNCGLVKQGLDYFNQMVYIYGLKPEQEHYACMVDLLGRFRLFKEALELIERMPFKADSRIWGSLLNACKLYSDTQLAEKAAMKLIELEPNNAGNYVMLSNIYAAAGKWDGVSAMRSFLKDSSLKKTPGCSWVEISGRVHEFRVLDRSHDNSQSIYNMLSILEQEIRDDTKECSVLWC
uniref:Pentatricopeptide repeat-containing protein n=1 Tax=Ananas comosus var. bracteatus TaxID=296719 RepID=A0A6V7QWJ0_ANACO